MTPLGEGLPSPATTLFKCQIQDIMPIINRLLIGSDNDEKHHKMLIGRQSKNNNVKDT